MPTAVLTKGKVYEGPIQWAQALRDLRARHDLTQKESAEIIGVSHRTWIAWENHQCVPTPITQRAIRIVFPDL